MCLCCSKNWICHLPQSIVAPTPQRRWKHHFIQIQKEKRGWARHKSEKQKDGQICATISNPETRMYDLHYYQSIIRIQYTKLASFFFWLKNYIFSGVPILILLGRNGSNFFCVLNIRAHKERGRKRHTISAKWGGGHETFSNQSPWGITYSSLCSGRFLKSPGEKVQKNVVRIKPSQQKCTNSWDSSSKSGISTFYILFYSKTIHANFTVIIKIFLAKEKPWHLEFTLFTLR